MKFEKKAGTYYVNSRAVSSQAFNAIFGEIWSRDDLQKVLDAIENTGSAVITFNDNKLIELDSDNAHSKEINLLKAKLAAVENVFLKSA